MNQGQQCHITKSVDEQTTGTLLALPGKNPVQPEGKTAVVYTDNVTPPLIAPVYAYTGDSPTTTGKVVSPGQTNPVASSPVVPSTPSTPVPPKPSSSSHTTAASPHVTIPKPSPVLIPTASHPNQVLPAEPTGTAKTASSPSSGSGAFDTCNDSPKKRRHFGGLDYHRRHRRSSYVQRHDFFHEDMY